MKDVHTAHCCIFHGCKYSNSDCTVTTGKAPQSDPCESCFDSPTLKQFLGGFGSLGALVLPEPEVQDLLVWRSSWPDPDQQDLGICLILTTSGGHVHLVLDEKPPRRLTLVKVLPEPKSR